MRESHPSGLSFELVEDHLQKIVEGDDPALWQHLVGADRMLITNARATIGDWLTDESLGVEVFRREARIIRSCIRRLQSGEALASLQQFYGESDGTTLQGDQEAARVLDNAAIILAITGAVMGAVLLHRGDPRGARELREFTALAAGAETEEPEGPVLATRGAGEPVALIRDAFCDLGRSDKGDLDARTAKALFWTLHFLSEPLLLQREITVQAGGFEPPGLSVPTAGVRRLSKVGVVADLRLYRVHLKGPDENKRGGSSKPALAEGYGHVFEHPDIALHPIDGNFLAAIEAAHAFARSGSQGQDGSSTLTNWDVCWRLDVRNRDLIGLPSHGRSISGAAALAFKALLGGRTGELSCLVLGEVGPNESLEPVGRELEKLQAAAKCNDERARLGRGVAITRAVVSTRTVLTSDALNPHVIDGIWVKKCATVRDALEFALCKSKLPPGPVDIAGQVVNLADPRDCDGYPVVFLHGWLNRYEDLGPLISNLRDGFRVIAMDFPGFGSSPPPGTVWGCEQYARHIVDVLKHLGVEKAHFVGHSFGGRIALYIAALYPDVVDKLVLIAPSGLRNPVTIGTRVKRRLSGAARAIGHFGVPGKAIRNLIFKITASKDFKEFVGRHPVMHDVTRKIIQQDVAPLVPRIGAPTLLLWGDNDEKLPVGQGHRLRDLMREGGNREAEIHVYRGAGHWLHLEMPWVYHAIRRHFDEGLTSSPRLVPAGSRPQSARRTAFRESPSAPPRSKG